MERIVRAEDTAARYGGDEFVLVLDGLPADTAPAALAERLTEELAKPYRMGSITLHVGASVGIAIAGGNSTPDELIRRADRAMYATKTERRMSASVPGQRLALTLPAGSVR